ncbi:tetratricopeptide repeat protein [Flavobacterium beibuense]|uniref:Tetratricopeptide repeat protein n=1 Tax=Flavobacterium beibuense TaxID=657326 RepID=A0A444W429_9FLAO|nr:hypothetical protein [Flavobacterium beibuense]RYJ40438.1 hypothetical protein NU09_3426 [Flavobacterium beibuense]
MLKNNLHKAAGVLCLLFMCFRVSAQVNLDSLKNEINLMVYNNPEEAIRKAKEAYPFIKEDDTTLKITYLLAIANAYAILKKHDEVMETALKAKNIADTRGTPLNKIQVLGFIAGEYRRLQLNDKALVYINQAEKIYKTETIPDSLKYFGGNILFVKGLIQKDNLGCEYALPYFNEAAEIFKANTQKKINAVSFCIASNNAGDCYIQLNDLEAAKENFTETIKYAESVNATQGAAYGKIGLSRVLKKEDKYKEAIALLNEVLHETKNIDDASMKSQLYRELSEDYLSVENFEKQGYYNKLALEEEKKLSEEEKKSLNKVANKISVENKKNEQEQSNKLILIVVAISFLLLTILLIIFLKIRKKRRSLEQKRSDIEDNQKK